MARLLDDADYQAEILNRIRLTGQLKDCWEGICKEKTFYTYKKDNKQFLQAIKQAQKDFKKTLWKERPDLKLMAIRGLERNLQDWEQRVVKEHYEILEDENGKQFKKLTKVTVTKWTRPPAKWAIEQVLDMKTLTGSGSVEEHEDRGLEAVDFDFVIIDETNVEKYKKRFSPN